MEMSRRKERRRVGWRAAPAMFDVDMWKQAVMASPGWSSVPAGPHPGIRARTGTFIGGYMHQP